jgi:hypothetical protein
MKAHADNDTRAATDEEALVAEVLRATKGLRFGQVLLTVHNSRVVQIDRTEKMRLDASLQYNRGGGI